MKMKKEKSFLISSARWCRYSITRRCFFNCHMNRRTDRDLSNTWRYSWSNTNTNDSTTRRCCDSDRNRTRRWSSIHIDTTSNTNSKQSNRTKNNTHYRISWKTSTITIGSTARLSNYGKQSKSRRWSTTKRTYECIHKSHRYWNKCQRKLRERMRE